MNSGMVVDNTCGTNGGGVYVSDTATMTVSGNPVVMSNKRNADNTESDSNVLLMGSSVIGVTGELVEFGANIYVSRDAGPGIFTTGYSDHNTEYPSKYFRSNDPEYNIVLSSSEARIDTSVPDVKYISYEWNNRLESSEQYTDNEWTAWPDGATNVPGGMYVLNKNVTVNGLVSLGDNTSLILCDGCTLNVKGLYIPKGKTLTVYGQDKGTGKIVSTPSAGAGIGATSNNHPGGNIVIHGGTIQATGHDHCAGIGSNDGNKSDVGSFTMYNGTVTATGGSQSAGIGGGRDCDGGKIAIYGGTITATGKDSSAGIGGSDASGSRADNSTIDIYGGTITATGNSKGAGIGGGEYGHATINISGGTITATGGKSGGAGIGSGVDGSASTVSITGGTINATASSGGKGIGDGKNTSGSTVTLDYTEATKKAISVTATSFGGTVTLGKPFKMASKGLLFQAGDVADNSYLAGGALTWWDGEGTDTAYVNAAGEDMGTQKCIPVTAVATTWSDGWYAVNGNVSIDSRIQVYGTVNLILCDGCNLNAIKGISLPEGSHLIIWQQSEGSGTLTATGAQKYHAGIGGYIKDGNDIDANYGSLTINGGKIYATGAEGAAGIGTSYGTSGTLTINGGEITATGGKYASGIGCDVDPNKGKTTIATNAISVARISTAGRQRSMRARTITAMC